MSLPDIPDDELSDLMVEAFSSVFKKMLSFDSEYRGAKDFSGRKAPAPDLGGEEMSTIYVGSVGFVGHVNGVVYVYMKSHFAENAATKLTGIDGEEIDNEIISDACGEITNVFAGRFKNSLNELGYSSVLTIPTVLSGDELYISTLGVVKHLRQNFMSQGDEIVADLVLADPTV